MAVQDLQRIEEKLDRTVAGAVPISDHIGGVMFSNMAEVMEFAKLMSLAQNAVPAHLRGNPGACLAVVVQSLEWRFSPFQVANKSYEVNGRIAYESQLIHAVIEARAPLRERLRVTYEGDGAERVCVITGHFRGELDPVIYRSPAFGTIHPKNSPLWKSDPDQQQFHYSSRAWARRYAPDVLLGVYSRDELIDSEIGAENARDITPTAPNLGERLRSKAKKAEGFGTKGVDHQIAGRAGEPDAEPADDDRRNARAQVSKVWTDAAGRAAAEAEPAPEPQRGTQEPQAADQAPAAAPEASGAQPGAPDVAEDDDTASPEFLAWLTDRQADMEACTRIAEVTDLSTAVLPSLDPGQAREWERRRDLKNRSILAATARPRGKK